MTKHIAEKMTLNEKGLHTCVVRSGNIWGSRGSCIPYFVERKEQGKKIHLTDERMSRWFVGKKRLSKLIENVIKSSEDKAIYIPKMREYKIVDIIALLDCEYEVTGINEGEKLEEMVVWDNEELEAHKNYYIIRSNK